VNQIKAMAGIATLVMLFSIFCFALLIRLNQWPNRGSSFNVWINLPTFDPTTGGDVVKRLRRDSLVNVILGVFAPFVLPVVAVVAANHIEINVLSSPHALVWGITLWMFIPLSMLMRGLAMSRVADMIGQRRARLTASVASDGPSSPALVALAAFSAPATADTLRLAVFHTALSRDGPGLLLRDIVAGDDPQVLATLAVIAAAEADILLLLDMDFDAGLMALTALAEALGGLDAPYPHRFAAPPNTGRPTGVDLDGDGRTWRARDAHGYGLFSGDGGMAILSRVPIGAVRDFSDLPWMALPESAAGAVTPPEALEALRLHSVAAWDVELLTPAGAIHILASHASPPVFDGPEDRNGLRNRDELRFWSLYLGGWSPDGPALRRRPVRGDGDVQRRSRNGERGGARGCGRCSTTPSCKTPNRCAGRARPPRRTGPRTGRAACGSTTSCRRGP
jgi:hypothetical protein